METNTAKNIFKSTWAVFAGFLSVVILSVATDSLLEKIGVFPPAGTGLFITWMLVVAFIYRSAYAVVGGFITAKLAPTNPMNHVKVLAILGTLGGIMGVAYGWNMSDHWYPVALAITAFPLTWWGGKIKCSKSSQSQ